MSLPPPDDSGYGPVGLGEIARRLQRQETALTEGMREIRQDIAALHFVDATVYAVERRELEGKVADLRADVRGIEDARAADRRLIWTSLIAPVLMILIGIVVAASVTGTP